MTSDVEIIKSNLEEYPFIKRFLGDIIDQRLAIEDYEYGMLTACLLDEPSKPDLQRLESVLQLGEKHCADFKTIFHERTLPKNKGIDGEIINLLAEIKAFEYLHHNGFKEITKVKRRQDVKTVDFIATRNGENYAVEVTRLGLASSERKKHKYLLKKKYMGAEITMVSGQNNIEPIRNQIRDAVENEYPQIKAFCKSRGGTWKGILVISIGRDYFIANKYVSTLMYLTPKSAKEAAKQEWESLKERPGDYKFLNHVVITMGKDLQ